ncbi:MAG TPA: hypothetical protein ENH23_03580 [candidate division Zixibacteria bacterium]|nr:hypothetical protein [candidate division Zixibacteria bacterium]
MKKLLLIVFVLLLLGGSIVTAQTDSNQTNSYVSLNGKFYIEYPSDWKQIPYTEVDAYLSSKKAGRPLYDYDAVFASNESNPFYTGSYFIMSVEKVGNLSNKQIDSVLHVLSQNFGKGIKYFPVANFLADIKTNSPNYDKDSKTVTIYNKIVQNETSIKNSLIIMKFYDFGIATFYCYALGDAFETDKEIFSQIAASLSTEDIKSRLPKEQVKVADIDTTKKSFGNSDDDSSNTAIYISLGVVLLIILMRKKRKKNS